MIGAGHWGPNLIRNFHNPPKSRVVWVIDTDRTRLDQVTSRFPEIQVGTDASSALADDDVTAVVVATPTSTHYQLAKSALESGKHVLVEKPITNSTAHAEDLCALAERNQLILMVGHVFVYNSGVQAVKRFLDEGDLGNVYYVSMVRTNLGPIRVDVSAAWDLASHDVSIANYWLNSGPLTASAVGGNWINKGIEDALFITLKYPDEVLVNLHASWLNPRKARDITVVGERRMLTLDDMNLSEPLRIYDKGVAQDRIVPSYVDTFASFRASVREGDITIPKVASGEPLQAECDHFLECIKFGKQPLTGGREGLAVVRVLEAIERSARGGGREEQVT